MEMTFRYRIYRIAVYQPAIMIINTQISESGVCCQPLGLKLASLQLNGDRCDWLPFHHNLAKKAE
jgi:hypothetical protein